MKRKMILCAQIFEYIFAFIYALGAAVFFSLSINYYWFFLGGMVLSLCLGLRSESIKYDIANGDYKKKDFIVLIIITILSLVGVLSFVFNLIALCVKGKEVEFEKDYNYTPKGKKKLVKSACLYVCIASLVLLVLSSFFGGFIESNKGSVLIKDGTITKVESDMYLKDQGLNGTSYEITDPTVSISYTMYKPKDASSTNLYPVIIVVPGFTRTKATMSQYAIEFTRRGAVTFVIDPGSQGSTTYGGYQADEDGNYILDEFGNKTQNSYSVARSGAGYLLQYIYNDIDDFDFIDRDFIGLVGHSAGGGDACKLAADFAGNTYEESIVKALYVSGYIKTSAANVFYKLRSNTAMSYAKYDEGSFRYQDENQAYEIIAKRFINEVNSKSASANGFHKTFEEDKEYGDIHLGTYRIIHHEEINHCFEMYDPLSISNTINFFRQTLNLNTELEDSSLIWYWQEIANGLSLALGFTFIISLLFVLVHVPGFRSLYKAFDRRREKELEIRDLYSSNKKVRARSTFIWQKRSFAKRLLFWLPTILTAIIACLDYIPLARLSMDLFPDAAGNIYTYYFPARMMNAVFLWAVVNGAIGLAIWVLTGVGENIYYYIEAAIKKEPSRADWSKFKGLGVKPLDLLKSLFLTILLFGVFYGLIQLSYLLTHQDFRFMLISASPLNKRFLVTWAIYLGGFYVFYLSNSIRMNLGIAREGYKEWQNMLIGGLANSLGLVFIIIINYVVYMKTGTVFYGYYSATDQSEMWLYINMVFGLIPMMFILPIFNRLAYKRMGNVYSGALLWCMIFIMMSLSASISFIPM